MSACYKASRISAYRLPHGEAIGVVLLDTPALFAAEFADRQQLGWLTLFIMIPFVLKLNSFPFSC